MVRAEDIATNLEYTRTRQALRVNVDDDDNKKLEALMDHEARGLFDSPLDYNARHTIYILMNQVCTL